MPAIQPPQLLQALGWSLINSLWQMALLWLLYSIISGAGKKFSAQVRHLMALLMTAIGSLWFILSLVTRLLSPGTDEHSSIISLAPSTTNNLLVFLYAARQMINNILPYLSFAYLGSIFYLFARYLHYYQHLEELKSSGLQKIQGELRLFCASTASHMGIRKKISVWLSSAIDSPVTIGFLKPVILVPIATVTHLTTEQVESILLHELTHIKRNDYLINLFITITGNIFFFNPFSRLLIATIKKEREHCCDDLVLQFKYNPHDYASALLSLEKTRHGHQHFALAAVGRNDRLLLERVRRVTGHPHTGSRHYASLICGLLLAVVAGLVVCVQPVRLSANRLISLRATLHPGEGPGMILRNVLSSITSASHQKQSANQTAKAKHLKSVISDKIKEETENELTLVSNEDVSGDQSDDQVSPAIQTDEQVFSIAPTAKAAPVNMAYLSDAAPYVPSSSFSMQVTEDTLQPGERLSYNEVKAKETMEKTLQALSEIDWKQIEKKITTKDSKVNMGKLQEQINKSLRQLNWESIDRNNELPLSDADEKRISNNIKVQLETLKRVESRNRQEALRLQTRINEDRVRLQKNKLKKQLESIHQAEEVIRKKYKIVYI